jgi:hypothetical protein
MYDPGKKYRTNRKVGKLAIRNAELAALAKILFKGVKNKLRTSAKIKSKTKTKSKLHQKVSLIAGGPNSESKFFYGKRKVPKAYTKVIKALAKNYVALNNAQRISVAVGLQGANTLLTMFGPADMNTILTTISSNKTNRAVVMSCSAEIMLTNMDLAPARVTLYDVIARRDIPSSSLNLPDVAWKVGYADEGGSNSNYSIIGTTPFSNDTFVQFYKVLKITNIVMSQGQTHFHRVNFSPNRLIDGEYINYDQQGYKGLTCHTMIVHSGMPANDSVTKTQVSTGVTNIDVVNRIQYKYTWLTDNTTNYKVTNSLPGSFTVAQDLVDIGSGTIVTDSNA